MDVSADEEPEASDVGTKSKDVDGAWGEEDLRSSSWRSGEEGSTSSGGGGSIEENGFRKVSSPPLGTLPMLCWRLLVSLSSLSVSSSIPLPSSSTLRSWRWSKLIRRASRKSDPRLRLGESACPGSCPLSLLVLRRRGELCAHWRGEGTNALVGKVNR